jgi:hypothetical protein
LFGCFGGIVFLAEYRMSSSMVEVRALGDGGISRTKLPEMGGGACAGTIHRRNSGTAENPSPAQKSLDPSSCAIPSRPLEWQ